MLSNIDNRICFDLNYCQQCGACSAVCAKTAITFHDLDNGIKEIVVDDVKCVRCMRCVSVCPANREYSDTKYMERLKSIDYCLAYNGNKDIRRASSSGGVCRTLIIESLRNDIVDGVYSLRKLEEYPSAIGEFYTKENIPEYDDIPNSVYHSIMMCSELEKVKKVKRLMLVGTSCQLYALEKALKGKYEEIYKVCIFCKQQKTLQSTRWLVKAMGAKLPEEKIYRLRYRGDGWPGNLMVMGVLLPWNRAAGLPFGRRLWSVPGCDICADPFGMEVNTDLSLMDPWLIREPNDLGETLVSVYTERGQRLLDGTKNLIIKRRSYQEIAPALGEFDVKCKRLLHPFFKGEKVDKLIAKAGKAEIRQRKELEWLVETLPRLPFVFYRILNRLYPRRRNLIIAKYESERNNEARPK